LRIRLEGRVQGVGFRPFVSRLAHGYALTGYVQNRTGEVEILACGDEASLADFCRDLVARAPSLAEPRLLDCIPAAPEPAAGFEIRASQVSNGARVFVPPDSFLCDDCRRELEDPADRRHGYAFLNCTQCGPRYTLIKAMPYDRTNTSMASFELCAECQSEYADPADRRFHAEPTACPACGPELRLCVDGEEAERGEAALAGAIALLAAGRIVAVKGVGGYHLVCDATNAVTVRRLRRRKHRPHKPFAVMVPLEGPDGLDAARQLAEISPSEAGALASPVRPIVLVRTRRPLRLPAGIAPGLAELGLILPYSPLHQLLSSRFGGPLVATSANVSGEPVVTDPGTAEARLGSVADAFLHHDRPILRPADDPVVRESAGRVRPLRLGRGNAPLEAGLPWRLSQPTIAVGGQMKTTLALAWDNRVVVSPHIGDMDSPRSLEVFETLVSDLQRLYGVRAERIVCDAHPGYTTHRWAGRTPLPVVRVQHHRAHASALVAEHGALGPWLVFTWDGTGAGEDDTLWGGEALFGTAGSWRRVASLRQFRIPGGERAAREPWRSAAGLFWGSGLPWHDGPKDLAIARAAHDQGLNSPLTSAAGRLFDAAAVLVTGVRDVSYEAAGPMRLEALCRTQARPLSLPLARNPDEILESDWRPLLGLLADRRVSEASRAECFHATMAGIVRDQAVRLRRDIGVHRVGLTGGVFQNRVLAQQAVALLEEAGFETFLPERVPVNDGGLSFGQVAECAALDAGQYPC
jgi:hydrogenase maturation protein HypF